MKYLLLLFLFFQGFYVNAQSNYKAIDEFVASLGPMADKNLATVADTITRPFAEKEQKARAIFFWIANHVQLDPKAIQNADTRNILPEKVMQFRKATGLGFANLYQEMCSLAGIRCLVVDGYTNFSAAQIGEKPDGVNHSWNVVQLGQSPDKWFYVDAALASGFPNAAMRTATRKFTSEYFFANQTSFNLTHYPDNAAWQLGRPASRSQSDFFKLPLLYPASITLGLQKFSPTAANLKTDTKKPLQFSYQFRNDAPAKIELVSIVNRKISPPVAVEFKTDGHTVTFSHGFAKYGEFNLQVLADGQPLIEYLLEVEEKD